MALGKLGGKPGAKNFRWSGTNDLLDLGIGQGIAEQRDSGGVSALDRYFVGGLFQRRCQFLDHGLELSDCYAAEIDNHLQDYLNEGI